MDESPLAGVADRLGREFCRARRGCDGVAIRSVCAETRLQRAKDFQRPSTSDKPILSRGQPAPILGGAEDFVRTAVRQEEL